MRRAAARTMPPPAEQRSDVLLWTAILLGPARHGHQHHRGVHGRSLDLRHQPEEILVPGFGDRFRALRLRVSAGFVALQAATAMLTKLPENGRRLFMAKLAHAALGACASAGDLPDARGHHPSSCGLIDDLRFAIHPALSLRLATSALVMGRRLELGAGASCSACYAGWRCMRRERCGAAVGRACAGGMRALRRMGDALSSRSPRRFTNWANSSSPRTCCSTKS